MKDAQANFIIRERKQKEARAYSLPKMYTENDNTGFEYPHVYTYEILDSKGHPFEIRYNKTKCSEPLILTRRSGYSRDDGRTSVKLIHDNGNFICIQIKAGCNVNANVIKNIYVELIRFDKYNEGVTNQAW